MPVAVALPAVPAPAAAELAVAVARQPVAVVQLAAVPAVPAVPAAAPVNEQAFAVELVSDEQPVAALFAVLVA